MDGVESFGIDSVDKGRKPSEVSSLLEGTGKEGSGYNAGCTGL
jgi:hypothetical protein